MLCHILWLDNLLDKLELSTSTQLVLFQNVNSSQLVTIHTLESLRVLIMDSVDFPLLLSQLLPNHLPQAFLLSSSETVNFHQTLLLYTVLMELQVTGISSQKISQIISELLTEQLCKLSLLSLLLILTSFKRLVSQTYLIMIKMVIKPLMCSHSS